jgi:hypothetical protein
MTTTALQPSKRRFSIAQLALLVPWVAIAIDAWKPIRDNSFLWHVRAGTLQAQAGEVLTEDPFSFTMAGADWLTQSWLVELLYGWLEGFSGLGFVPWMSLAVNIVTFFAIGLIAYRMSKSVTATVFVLVLSTLVLLSFMVPRPVIFSYALMVLVILAWDRPSLRWAVPFLIWLWASAHGSFAIGLAYIGLTLIMRKEWRALPTAFVAGAASLVTAHGIGVVEILLDFGEAREALALMSEWRRPTLDEPLVIAFAGGVVFIVIGAFLRRIEPKHLWILVPFLGLALSALRAVPPAWLGLVPLVSLSMYGLSIGSKGRMSNASAVVFLLVVFALPFLLADDAELDGERLPVEAAANLEPIRTFHDDRTGGYLIWSDWPEMPIYLDDRAELYLDRLEEFVAVRSGAIDWRPVFARDGIEQALLFADEPFAETLIDAGWQTTHEDETYVVLVPS